jgi:putative N6-adenine-specific DNA methylase
VPSSISAFDKRLKRRVSGRTNAFFAVCPPGLTGLCQKELLALAPRLDRMGLLSQGQTIDDIDIQVGGVSFNTRLDLACLANLFLGTPTRILMRLARFRATHFAELEKGLKAVDWELFLPTLPRIRASAKKSRLFHSDAIAARCRQVLETRFNETPESSQQVLMVRGEADTFDISLDMGGDPLFKRGIKPGGVRAPLRETLAFAMLTRLNLSVKDVLADPMAGSGTFSLEGAMIRAGIPPGMFRSFAFEAWPGFQQARFAHAKKRIQDNIIFSTLPPIYTSDLDPGAVEALEQTRSRHDFLHPMDISCQNFFNQPAPAGTGVVVLNPPYGKRIGRDKDITGFYREIGRKLSRDYRGWRFGIICPQPRLMTALDLALTPMPLFHGGLDIAAGLGTIP